MKTCPYCLSKLSDTAKKCKYCGERIKKDSSKDKFDDKIQGITSGIWRAIIVVYFIITIPIFLLFWWGIAIDTYGPSSYYGIPRDWGNTILWFILIPLIYIILTDILRGAMYYITTGKYELFFLKKLKKL